MWHTSVHSCELIHSMSSCSFLTLWLTGKAMDFLNTFCILSPWNPRCVAHVRVVHHFKPTTTVTLGSILGYESYAGVELALHLNFSLSHSSPKHHTSFQLRNCGLYFWETSYMLFSNARVSPVWEESRLWVVTLGWPLCLCPPPSPCITHTFLMPEWQLRERKQLNSSLCTQLDSSGRNYCWYMLPALFFLCHFLCSCERLIL